MRKLFVITLLSFLAVFSSAAQEISVKSISEETTVLRARTSPVYDNNGELCALVEVAAPSMEGIEFDKDKTVGAVIFSKGVYSIYIPVGTKKIGFRHDEYLPGTIDFAAAGITIAGGTTYSVILEKPAGPSAVGFLLFNVTPKNALLELDGEILPVGEDGFASKTVLVGRSYHYTASLKGYHTVEGTASVSETGKSEEVVINLKEAFGSLRIGSDDNATIAGASVYIDNELLPQKAPLLLNDIASGSHTVRIVRDLYKSVTTTIQVNDGAETIVDPILEGNYATVNVSVPSGAEIWIDNVRRSTGSWLGTLASGTHIIEARSGQSVLSSQVFEISASTEVQNITLTASHGSLIVSSSPVKATVLLDGKDAGVTPLLLSDIETGQHEITLSKEGFASVTKMVNVETDKNTEVSIKLEAAESNVSMLPVPSPANVSAEEHAVNPEEPTVTPEVPAVAGTDVSAQRTITKTNAKGAFFVGGGIGMNYLQTYERPDLSFDLMAGYLKKYGGYVHLNKNLGGDFEYKDYKSAINVSRMMLAAGLTLGIAPEHFYLLTGIGFFNRELTLTGDSKHGTYVDDNISAVALDLGGVVRFGHIGFYIGASIPTDYQYSDVHAGISVLF